MEENLFNFSNDSRNNRFGLATDGMGTSMMA